jgi:ribosomal protein S18 acetylase RimI-like enzyme
MMIQIIESHYTELNHNEAIVFLLNSYASDLMGGGRPLSDYVKTHLVSELKKRPNIHTLLAFQDENPVGLVICIESFSSFACKTVLNLHDFVVLPAFQHQGIGRLMLQEIEKLARKLDCCKMTLEVLEGNIVAQNLYKSVGFHFYQLDEHTGRALFMEKKIL